MKEFSNLGRWLGSWKAKVITLNVALLCAFLSTGLGLISHGENDSSNSGNVSYRQGEDGAAKDARQIVPAKTLNSQFIFQWVALFSEGLHSVGNRGRSGAHGECGMIGLSAVFGTKSRGVTSRTSFPGLQMDHPTEAQGLYAHGFVHMAQSKIRAAHEKKAKMKKTLMRFQKSSTAFTSNVYSVRIKGRQHRALMSLQSGEKPSDEEALPRKSMAAFLESSASGVGPDGEEFPSFVVSNLQRHLDEECRRYGSTAGRNFAYARTNEYLEYVYCLEEAEVDFSACDKLCVDSCSEQASCWGVPNMEIFFELQRRTPLLLQRLLIVDLNALIPKYCVTSRVQAAMDLHCGVQKLARMVGSQWLCYDGFYRGYGDGLTSCTTNCGEAVRCFGVASSEGGRPLEDASTLFNDLIRRHCPCDEDLSGVYMGCQSKTRMGLSCQNWSTQYPHRHDSITEDHNYCRNPTGGDPWCFTTDPDVRFDFCDPLGIRQQSLTPGEDFDIEYRSEADTSPFKALRIFDAVDGITACGDRRLRLSVGVELPIQTSGTIREDPLVHVADGVTSVLTWRGLKVQHWQTNPLLVCLCEHEFFHASNENDVPCAYPGNYTIHAGYIQVRGPIFDGRIDPGPYDTSRPFTLQASGQGFSTDDSVFIVRATTPDVCLTSSLGEALRKAYIGDLDEESHEISRLVDVDRLLHILRDNVTITKIMAIPTLENNMLTVEAATTGTIRVTLTGDYIACWRQGGREGALAAYPMKRFRVTGFNTSEASVAMYAPTPSGQNENLFSLFISCAGLTNLVNLGVSLKHPGAGGPCSGEDISTAHQVTVHELPGSTDDSIFLRARGMLLKHQDNIENLTLHVCVQHEHKTVHTGTASVRDFALYPTVYFSYMETSDQIPVAVYSLSQGPYGPLGYHWTQERARALIFVDVDKFFCEGDFSKVLLFTVFPRGIHVLAWETDDVAPVSFAFFRRTGVQSITSYITYTNAIFYMALEGPPMIERVDVSNPWNFEFGQATHVYSDTLTRSVCCLNTVYTNPTKNEGPSILFLDPKAGEFVWLDEYLNLIQRKTIWPGMARELLEPRSMDCSLRQDQAAYESSSPVVIYDCYIADKAANRIVKVAVETTNRNTALVFEYSLFSAQSAPLRSPHFVVAYQLLGETLLYVLQEGVKAPDLLVSSSTDRTIKYYHTLDHQSRGLGIPVLPAILEIGEKDTTLSSVKMVLHRQSFRQVELQILPLSATAVATAVNYSPLDWYSVGDTAILEPAVSGTSSLSVFKSFALSREVPDFSYVSRIAWVDSSRGTLRLNILPYNDRTIEIIVEGTGVLNKTVTTIRFNIACKDGHAMREGMCVRCSVGSFNSIALIKQNPLDRWSSCKKCGLNQSTVAEGSTSEDQCLCAKGHQLDAEHPENGCIPCPPGSWKDLVSNNACMVSGCPANSSTQVAGATSPEAMQCSCFPGYVYNTQRDSCDLAEPGYFSKGGVRAEAIPCPVNTASEPSAEKPAVSLSSCLCIPGHEPADPSRLSDPTTAEYAFKQWLLSDSRYKNIDDTQVCVPCGRQRYKEGISADACLPCPPHSYAEKASPVSKRECSLCESGYYQTTNADMPCGVCPASSFCVGSTPEIAILSRFAGRSVQCPAFTETLGNGELNDNPQKCMLCLQNFPSEKSSCKKCECLRCIPGYELEGFDEETLMPTCRMVSQGSYKDQLSNISSTPCPGGGITEAMGAKSVSACSCRPGEYLSSDSLSCLSCPVATYCPGGRDAETGRHIEKISCPTNMTTDGGAKSTSSNCVCDKGYYKISSGVQSEEGKLCNQCLVNTYKDKIGNGACRQCSENSGTDQVGATSAAQCLCKPGYYYNAQMQECAPCSDPFSYCPGGEVPCGDDESSCVDGHKPAPPIPCPPNTRITAGFDTPSKLSDCICDRGFAYKETIENEETKVCEPCSPGSYKSSVQDAKCNGLCDAFATSLPGMQDQSQCFCEARTYFAANSCHACPTGATCPGGLTQEAAHLLSVDPSYTSISSADHVKPYAQENYFLHKLNESLESPNDWFFLKCPIKNSCLEYGECSETMADYLCSECKEGFTNTFNEGEICTKCPTKVWNLTFCVGYYLCLLLFNIFMAYMNVAAGFNRRSIHSIVIKIASNFVTCMSVLTVVDYDQIELPAWLTTLKSDVTEQMTSRRSHALSVDCLLRDGFGLSYADSFFYTMVFNALLPIVLSLFATIIMYVVVDRAKKWYRSSTQRKLNLLHQTVSLNMVSLAEQLREKYEEDRLFLIFRYIPLPGESRIKRVHKFFEDMIPIYVTVLFFIYTSTTRGMLSLLDCTAIDFGASHGTKSFLRAAMSVECTLSPAGDYFKFFLLGVTGLLFWSIGIPFLAFMVLYVNSKNLNSRETRLKYGFLHNGFVKKFWYWETVVFARKLSVLVVSSVSIFSITSLSAARILVSAGIAIAFNIIHLRCQPFDKRSYLTLDRLENHSLTIWTLALSLMSLILGSGFSGFVNAILLLFIALPALFFMIEVGYSLVLAYFDNVRATRTFYSVPILRHIFRFFGYIAEKVRAREPVVLYDEEEEAIQFVAAKRSGKLANIFRVSNKNINYEERSYFLKIMAEALGFAIVHLKLEILPGSFLEFVLRLGLAFSKMEEDTQSNKASLQALAGGDISKLLDWTKQEEDKRAQRKKLVRARQRLAVKIDSFYTDLEKKLEEASSSESGEDSNVSAEDDEHDRFEDLGGSRSDEGDSVHSKDAEEDGTSRLEELQNVICAMTEEEQEETMYLFDEGLMNCGLVLSELYLALLKLQLKDSRAIGVQFNAFREKKNMLLQERTNAQRVRNRKLRIMRDAVVAVLTDPSGTLPDLVASVQDLERLKAKLERLSEEIKMMNHKLQSLKDNPELLEDGQDAIQWIDEPAGVMGVGASNLDVQEENNASSDFESASEGDTSSE